MFCKHILFLIISEYMFAIQNWLFCTPYRNLINSLFILQTVTVESVYNTAQILPTKTKPKKLVIMGSDGKRYCTHYRNSLVCGWK